MKKLFVAAAAIAVMAMFSCSKEIDENNGQEGPTSGLKAGTGFASFTFHLPDGSRATTEYEPKLVAVNDVNDGKIGFADLYMLVFDMNGTDGVLEYAAPVTSNPLTKLLRAGNKKIFVLANIGTPSNTANLQANLKTVVPSTLAPSATVAPFSSLVEGTTTYGEFSRIAFDAGTPQSWTVIKASTVRSYNLDPLSTRISEGTLGLPMSNSNANTFVLTANVSELDAANPSNGTPVANGSQQYNRFRINLDYLGAKGRLAMNQAASTFDGDESADITNPKYSIKNLAKYTSLVQNVVGGTPQSIYHSLLPFVEGVNVPQSEFDKHVDQASTVMRTVPTTAGDFIFVPENTSSALRRGQSSFYAINITYKPMFIVTEASWNNTQVNSNKIAAVTKKWDNAVAGGVANPGGLDGGNKYIYDPVGIVDQDGKLCNYFANLRVFADMKWMSVNFKSLTDPSYSTSAAYALLGSDPGTGFVFTPNGENTPRVFVDAQSWYRIDIGETLSATQTKYGVLRGNAYTATITNISGPGVPTEGELFTGIGEDDGPEDPVDALTFINVTIEVNNWNPIIQYTPIK